MFNCVYIHIPFCIKKCNYCAFCSYEALFNKEEYIKALIKEIKFHYKNEKLKTIYFGGGTPSLLKINELEKILSLLNYNKDTEVTLEANPNSLTFENLKEYKSLGINRISLGVQSFDDKTLQILGRSHTVKDIFYSVENIKKSEIDNFSIDLMYGLPEQKINDWKNTIIEAKKINPNHISLYGLKIEKGTKFYRDYLNSNKIPNLDTQAKMYTNAVKELKNSFIHYEFSNFAKSKKYISKHNSSYWTREQYLGLGISASGFIENKRYTNTSNFKEYINNPTARNYEILTTKEQIEEEIFLGLRLKDGINFEKINREYNIDIWKKYEKIFKKYIQFNLMEKTKTGIKLNLKGILVSNEILCEFIEI